MRITRLTEIFLPFEDVFDSASFMLVPLLPFSFLTSFSFNPYTETDSSLRFYLNIPRERASDGYVRTASSGTPAPATELFTRKKKG